MFSKKKKNSDLYEQYTHHGKKVWVIKEMKGKHRKVVYVFDVVNLHQKIEIKIVLLQIWFFLCVYYKI